MTRPICLQVYISAELSSLIRKAAKAKGISMSEWVRALLANACTEDELASRLDASIERISRRSVGPKSRRLVGYSRRVGFRGRVWFRRSF